MCFSLEFQPECLEHRCDVHAGDRELVLEGHRRVIRAEIFELFPDSVDGLADQGMSGIQGEGLCVKSIDDLAVARHHAVIDGVVQLLSVPDLEAPEGKLGLLCFPKEASAQFGIKKNPVDGVWGGLFDTTPGSKAEPAEFYGEVEAFVSVQPSGVPV